MFATPHIHPAVVSLEHASVLPLLGRKHRMNRPDQQDVPWAGVHCDLYLLRQPSTRRSVFILTAYGATPPANADHFSTLTLESLRKHGLDARAAAEALAQGEHYRWQLQGPHTV